MLCYILLPDRRTMNTFGRLLRLTSFGESHGTALGGIIDGFPAGFAIDELAIEQALRQRQGGQSTLTTSRREPDQVRFLSGIYEGRTLGTPIAFIIENADTRSQDYSALKDLYRPGHADFTYQAKYGHRDARGGGRASARETVVRVVAGALCAQWLRTEGIHIAAYLSQVGTVYYDEYAYRTAIHLSAEDVDLLQRRYEHRLPCPDSAAAERMAAAVATARDNRDSIGGVISCRVDGLPAGLGEPLYDKLSSRLASAMMSINATRGFEIGDGFALASGQGSTCNDPFRPTPSGEIEQTTNHCGGLLGGISTGAPLFFRTAFKPTSSIGQPQLLCGTDNSLHEYTITGRHDPCVALRAVPIVEAMTALTLMDFYLLHRAHQSGAWR